MTNTKSTFLPLAILIATFSITACNVPRPNPNANQTPAVTVLPSGSGSGSDPTLAATATPDFTPTPLPDPPAGWQEYSDSNTGLSFYYPPGWEVIPYDEHKIDVRAGQGDGWIEISTVDANNADTWNVTPETLSQPQMMIEALLTAAKEDGEFQPAQSIPSRIGGEVWTSQGVYEVLQDKLWIGVTALTDRAVIGLGHGIEKSEGWDSEMIPAYQNIIWSVRLAER